MTRFQLVTLRSKEAKVCGCGKRFTRTISAYQTVNPWNKNPDGSVKTRAQVQASVADELKATTRMFHRSALCTVCTGEKARGGQ
jgi:hypothetical protein